MRTPAEYLAAAQAALPQAEPTTQALVAIAAAQADADHYRALLLRALRRVVASTPSSPMA